MATVVRELINVIMWKDDDKTRKNAEKKVEKFLGTLKGVGLAVGAAIVAIGASAIKVAGDMEALNAQFETMLGSAEAASAMMQDLIDFSVKTPFTPKQLANSAKMLLNFGVATEKIMPTLQRLGDVSGGDAQRMDALSLAFGQMTSTGKLMGQDLLQMINAGFNPLQEISRTTGKSVAVLKEEMSKGAISAEMVAEAFKTATDAGGKFNGNMERLSKTLPGLLSTLQGIVELSLAGAVKEVEDEIKGIISELIKVFETTVRPLLAELMKSLVPLFKTIVSILGPVFQLLTPIFKLLANTLGFLARIITNAIMPLIKFLTSTFAPILEDINDLFNEIMKIVSPLLEMMFHMWNMIIKSNLAPFLMYLKLILKLITPLLKLVNLFLVPMLNIMSQLLGVMDNLIDKALLFFFDIVEKGAEKLKEAFWGLKGVLGNIRDFFIMMINMTVDGINLLIKQVNKIPGVKIDAIDKIDPEKVLKLKEDQRTVNNNTVQTNIDARGSTNPTQTRDSIRRAMATPFQYEILRVMEDM